MDKFSIELAISLSVGLAAVGGAIVSILLEKWPGLKKAWDSLSTSAKPLILLAGFLVLAELPVGLKFVGAPDWILEVMKWIPAWAEPNWETFFFGLVVGLVGYLTSQTVYFKTIRRNGSG